MADLTAFVTARLDEAEAHAIKDLWYVEQATSNGQWQAHVGYNHPHSYLRAGETEIAVFSSHRTSPPLADGEEDLHLFDAELACRLAGAAKSRAERVLREVEADRKLIAAYEAARAAVPPVDDWYEVADGVKVGRAEALEAALKIRAERFSDHPDYDKDWTPKDWTP